ncbi:MAG: hypothetical protein HYX53_10415 [Chloroflexi bacterium]|nr:hypothetical protein [Chloroflexota bacterium]
MAPWRHGDNGGEERPLTRFATAFAALAPETAGWFRGGDRIYVGSYRDGLLVALW